MRDQVVLEIQECLRMLPRTDQAKPRIIPDGIYGEETRAAVEEFQRSAELPVTGKVDLATWNALQRASAESAEQQGTPRTRSIPLKSGLHRESFARAMK